MIIFKITGEAISDIFSPGIRRCTEGFENPGNLNLKAVSMSPSGIVQFIYDDGKEEITEQRTTFETVRIEE